MYNTKTRIIDFPSTDKYKSKNQFKIKPKKIKSIIKKIIKEKIIPQTMHKISPLSFLGFFFDIRNRKTQILANLKKIKL